MTFFRYLSIQLLAYGIDMGSFLVMTLATGFNPLLANVCSKVLAGGFAYWAHLHFTFARASNKTTPGTVEKNSNPWRYISLLALNIPFNSLLLAGFLSVVSLPVLAKFISDSVGILVNFWISKRFVFAGAKTL
jgi:putative flippase GtrA